MPYSIAADSFHTKKLCSRLSSSEVRFSMEIGRFAFLRPPLGDLRATYDDHLKLIGKRVVDFLLVLIELFSLGVTAKKGHGARNVDSGLQMQTEKDRGGRKRQNLVESSYSSGLRNVLCTGSDRA